MPPDPTGLCALLSSNTMDLAHTHNPSGRGHPMNVSFVQAMLGVAIVSFPLTQPATAAPPAVHSVPLPGRNFPTEKELAKFLEPIPPPAIPDDPPPHEGAMFDYPQTIAPPDLILVEVLETLPGRPI